jgi:hypothetical protein
MLSGKAREVLLVLGYNTETVHSSSPLHPTIEVEVLKSVAYCFENPILGNPTQMDSNPSFAT